MALVSKADKTDRPASQGPFATGLLSAETGQVLLQTYTSKMTPRFPFVVISERCIDDLHAKRPALCLAVLTVAACETAALQRCLGRMFNDLVAERIARGTFPSLELLQGLLVQLAWYGLLIAHIAPV